MSHLRTAAIVGGGIGGLATAAALHQCGIEVEVYERAPLLAEVGAGISLWPNATRALRELGALEAVQESAGQIAALNVRNSAGRFLLRSAIDGYDAPALCAYRPDLVSALAARLPGGALHTGKALTSVRADGDRAQLAFHDGTEAEADIVIGADGIRSTVRSHVTGNASAPIYRGYPIWRGICSLPPSFVSGEISESWGDGRRFGLLSVGRGRAYWYATANQRECEADGGPDARKAEVLAMFSDWHAPIPEVIQSTPPEAVLRGDTYDRTPRRGWSRGRAVLVGDAAHPTTPNLGQGGCMAIEDALVLARSLTESSTVADAFATFEEARYKRTTRVTLESLWTGRLGQGSGMLAVIRNALARLTPGAMYARRLRWLLQYAS